MVVCRQRRITQYVRHIRATEDVKFSAHLQLTHRPLHHTEEVHKSLSESNTALSFFCVNNLVVTRNHSSFHINVVKIAEVYVS